MIQVDASGALPSTKQLLIHRTRLGKEHPCFLGGLGSPNFESYLSLLFSQGSYPKENHSTMAEASDDLQKPESYLWLCFFRVPFCNVVMVLKGNPSFQVLFLTQTSHPNFSPYGAPTPEKGPWRAQSQRHGSAHGPALAWRLVSLWASGKWYTPQMAGLGSL